MAKVDYDRKMDILYISKKGERVAFSINLMKNFVIDVTKNMKVVGVEIIDASKVLNVPKKELENITEANVSTYIYHNQIGAQYYIVSPKAKIESKVAIAPRGV